VSTYRSDGGIADYAYNAFSTAAFMVPGAAASGASLTGAAVVATTTAAETPSLICSMFDACASPGMPS
jgi:hypothetical protein